jgi:N-methylhydantoinase B
MSVDPFTLEIVRSTLLATADEMFVHLGRSSKSPIIYEALDYSCAIANPLGEIVAQSTGLPLFLASLSQLMKEVTSRYEGEGLCPGDILLANDVYLGGGTHLNDVAVVKPVFVGQELIAYVLNKAHWTDVGGKVPGGWSSTNTEIYQEGLRIPLVKLTDQHGAVNQDLRAIISNNVRQPDKAISDLNAQIAALLLGEKRLQTAFGRYGADVMVAAMKEIILQGEREAQQAIDNLPRGEFFAEDFIDDDGIGQEPLAVRVKVTISDSAFCVDFEGSAPEGRGPINCSLSATISACRTAFKAIASPRGAANDGFFRPLKVRVPPHSVFDARQPCATAAYFEASCFATELVWRALAEHLPERLSAGHFLSICGVLIVMGSDPDTGSTVMFTEAHPGGWGASQGRDGASGLVCITDGETYIIPVEVLENRYPLLVEKYCLRGGVEGAGRWRGGYGVVRSFRLLANEGTFTFIASRHRFPTWGANGGMPGSTNYAEVIADGRETQAGGKVEDAKMSRGDIASVYTANGGGFGKPTDRDAEMVRDDVLDGYITIEDAWNAYRVVIKENGMRIDELATARARSRE